MTLYCASKIRYASYDEAGLVLVNCKIKAAFRGNRHKQKRREQSVYYCGDCNGFHLTSRADRQVTR